VVGASRFAKVGVGRIMRNIFHSLVFVMNSLFTI
jgi:hypothetical protein